MSCISGVYVVWFVNVMCVIRSGCKSFFRGGRGRHGHVGRVGRLGHVGRPGRAAVLRAAQLQPAAAGAAHAAGLQEVPADILR